MSGWLVLILVTVAGFACYLWSTINRGMDDAWKVHECGEPYFDIVFTIPRYCTKFKGHRDGHGLR